MKELLQSLLIKITESEEFDEGFIELLIDIFNTIIELPKCDYGIIAIATYLIEVISLKDIPLTEEFIQTANKLKTHFLYLLIEYTSLNSKLPVSTLLYNKDYANYICDPTLV